MSSHARSRNSPSPRLPYGVVVRLRGMKPRILASFSLVALLGVGSVIYASVKDEALEALTIAALPTPERTLVYRCDEDQSIEAGFSEDVVGITVSDGRTFLLRQAASPLRFTSDDGQSAFTMDGMRAFFVTSGDITFENCIENSALDEQIPKGVSEGEVGIANLLSLGRSIRCQLSQNTEYGVATGTIHAKKHLFRADFGSTPGIAGTTHLHLISDGVNAYAWEEGTTLGMQFDLLVLAEEQANARAAGMLPPSGKVLWECSGWSGDDAIFTPPPSVYFSETPVPPLGMFWVL